MWNLRTHFGRLYYWRWSSLFTSLFLHANSFAYAFSHIIPINSFTSSSSYSFYEPSPQLFTKVYVIIILLSECHLLCFFTFSFVSFYSEMICIQFIILPRIKGAFLTVLCFNKLFSRYECQGKGRLKIRVIIIITTLMGTGCSSRILVLQVNFILVKNVGLWSYLHQLTILEIIKWESKTHFTEIKNNLALYAWHDMCVHIIMIFWHLFVTWHWFGDKIVSKLPILKI